MLNSTLCSKLDPQDWPAFVEAIAALVPAEWASLLVSTDAQGAVAEYGVFGAPAAYGDAAAAAIRPLAGLQPPPTNTARWIDPAPAVQGLRDDAAEAQPIATGQRLRQAVAPVTRNKGLEVWLAIAVTLADGDAAAEQELLDRLQVLSVLVAARIEDAQRILAARNQAMVDGLAHAGPISFLVSADGYVVAGSAAGHRLLERAKLLSCTPNRQLRLATPAASAELAGAIADVAERGVDDPSAQRVVRLEGNEAPQHWVVVVRPLGAESRCETGPLAGADRLPVCWVSLRGPRLTAIPTVEALRQAFKFSESEAELVRHLMRGRSVSSQAAERGVTPDAVNYHMKNIYLKTGCKRHTELLLLVQAVLGAGFADNITAVVSGDGDVAQ